MRRWAVALLVVTVLVTGIPFAREAFAVDRCLDLGGSYDYSTGQCDMTVTHAYQSFAVRHPWLVVSSAASALGAAVLLFGRRRGVAVA